MLMLVEELKDPEEGCLMNNFLIVWAWKMKEKEFEDYGKGPRLPLAEDLLHPLQYLH